MDLTKEQQNHLINLLQQVLVICRAKSSIPINSWHNLKLDIERAINGVVASDKDVVIQRIEKKYIKHVNKDINKVLDENENMRQRIRILEMENIELIRENKKLDQFERGVISLLKQKFKKH